MYRAIVCLPPDFNDSDLAHLGEALDSLAFSAVRDAKNAWMATWIFDTPVDLNNVKGALFLKAELCAIDLPEPLELCVEALPDCDWLSHTYKEFEAFNIGPFFIYGAHHAGAVPGAQIGLQIDAATAFGSGEHETTAGCLAAMASLQDQGLCPWNILDMGTGSGILAIAAWKLWKSPVLAVDHDEKAVRAAERHRDLNAVPGGATDMICRVGDGFAADIVGKKAPFELVIANILAGPLREMAPDLARVCDENGYVILSGILNAQADGVIAAYEACGLVLKTHLKRESWSTLILHYPG